jgi:hypothetical protein
VLGTVIEAMAADIEQKTCQSHDHSEKSLASAMRKNPPLSSPQLSKLLWKNLAGW